MSPAGRMGQYHIPLFKGITTNMRLLIDWFMFSFFSLSQTFLIKLDPEFAGTSPPASITASSPATAVPASSNAPSGGAGTTLARAERKIGGNSENKYFKVYLH